jgi:hypothetical protein
VEGHVADEIWYDAAPDLVLEHGYSCPVGEKGVEVGVVGLD